VKHLTAEDLLDLTGYEQTREEFRGRVIAHKTDRRVGVGPSLTFVFEDRLTVRFQLQEILRTERTVLPEKIQGELDAYNELIPGEHELSATLMIEIPDPAKVRPMLDRLIGIDEHVALEVDGRAVRASFDPKQFEEERISAVQYVRFPLGPELGARFADPSVPAVLRVDHLEYQHVTSLEGNARASLARDLKGGV
jgi:hypothetical protein